MCSKSSPRLVLWLFVLCVRSSRGHGDRSWENVAGYAGSPQPCPPPLFAHTHTHLVVLLLALPEEAHGAMSLLEDVPRRAGLRFVTTVGGSRAASGELLVVGSPAAKEDGHAGAWLIWLHEIAKIALECARAGGTTLGGCGSEAGIRKPFQKLAACKTLAARKNCAQPKWMLKLQD